MPKRRRSARPAKDTAPRQTLAETSTVKKATEKDFGSSAKTAYKKYLQGDHWEEFKKLIFEWRGRKCQLCQSQRKLQVHHMTYKRRGKEDPRDVLIVCDSCHKFIHERH